MPPRRVETVIRHSRWYMLAGAALLLQALLLNTPGVISGVVAVGLGACGAVFSAWRRDAGLWMLSLLFLAMLGPVYAILEYESLVEIFRGSEDAVWLVLDCLVATFLLQIQVRFLLTVSKVNWAFSRTLSK